MLKTTRITVETETLMVIRRAKTAQAWCPDCRAEVNAITLSSGSLAEAATAEQLRQWLDTGKLHVWQQAAGSARLCVPSLLQCIECEGVQTFSPFHPEQLNQPRRKCMKLTSSIANLFRFTSFVLALAFFAAPVWAQPNAGGQGQTAAPSQYTILDLGTLGGSFSLAYAINDNGQIDGFSTLPGDNAVHSILYNQGVMTDLGTLGGANSESFANLNNAIQVAGTAETSVTDPNNENFCSFGTNLICLGFVWQNGIMTPLGTLGGNNGQAAAINNRGQVAGYSETATADPDCPAPQVLQFLPTLWTAGRARALPLYPGDTEGAAFWINNRGETVGASGSCAPYDPRYALPLQPRHALLWRQGVRPIDLGNLGGQINNAALAINDRDQIVGASDISGDTYQHAFLWQKGVMTDLGTLQGDVVSAAVAISNRGQVTGVSQDANGNIRAFLWQNGAMYDLNSLIAGQTPLYLLHGFGINSSGEVVGFAVNTNTGEVHGFLAIPTSFGGGAGSASPAAQGDGSVKFSVPENARKQMQQWMHIGRFGDEPPDPCLMYSKLSPACRLN